MNTDLSRIDTEQRNPATAHIDTLSTLEMAALINQEDHRCAEAVKEASALKSGRDNRTFIPREPVAAQE